MKTIPLTDTAPIIRTDFSDSSSWEKLLTIARNPAEPFMFNLSIVDDREYEGETLDQLLATLPGDYPHSFLVVADGPAMAEPDYPLLIVDLLETKGRQFRATAAQLPAVENNLSIANMDFGEYAGAVDGSGVFRGFP